VSWLVGAGVSLELMIRTAARKLPASNLLDTAAASLLLSFDFLLVLLSVVCELLLCAHECVTLAKQLS